MISVRLKYSQSVPKVREKHSFLLSQSLKYSEQTRNLDIALDPDFSFENHMTSITRTVLYHLKYIESHVKKLILRNWSMNYHQ